MQGSAYSTISFLSSDDLIPPSDLLELIVSWIFEDPRLILITFLNTPIAANLPIGFLELTPLTGLIRWCVKAPLAYKRKKKASLSNGHPPSKIAKDSTSGEDRDCHQLYSKLHLSVLQVLMMLQGHLTEKNLYGRLGLVPFDHVVPLVEEINRLSDELNPLNASKEIELALDRLAQALQVAMASGALLCTRGKLSVGLEETLAQDSFPPACGRCKGEFLDGESKDQCVHSRSSSLPLLGSDSAGNTSGNVTGWGVRKETSLMQMTGVLLCRAGELIFYHATCTGGLYLGVCHGDKFDPLRIACSYLKSTV